MQTVFKAVRTCVAGKIEEVARKEAAKEFGKALEQMCGLTDALDAGTAVEDFPRLFHQVSLTPVTTG